MNKFLTKIAGAVACLAMAIGVGVGVASKQARPTYADPEVSTLTFTSACGGSGTANDGAVWTVTSDGTESTFDGTKGIHYGTSSAQVKYIQLSTDDISGTISKVVVNASTANGVTASVSVKIGDAAFGGAAQSLTSSAANYTFNGSASGEIVVRVEKPSKAAKAIYCKSIAVTYSTGGGQQPASTVQSVTINNAPQSTVTGVNVGSDGPLLTASATMRTGEDVPAFTWASDNENAVKVNASTGALQYIGNGTAHITATASLPAGDEAGDTNIGTVTITTSNLKGSSTNPFTVSEALAVAEATGTTATTYDCYTSGIVSRVKTDESYNSQFGNKIFWISADGSANNELEAYHCLYLNGQQMSEAQFNSIEANDNVTIVGKLVTYNSTKEYAQGCYLTEHTKPALPRVSITENSQSIAAGETLTLHATVENPVQNYSVTWESGDNSILTVESTGELTALVTAGNNGGSTTVRAKMLNGSSEVVTTSSPITITVTVPLLSNGDTIIFYYDTNYLTDINISSNTHYGNRTETKGDAVIYTVEAGSAEGSFAFSYEGSYLYWNSGNSLDYSDSITSNSSWNVSGASLTNCSIVNVNTSTRSLRYNSGSPRFACYEGTQQPVSIEKVEAPQVDTVSATLEDKTYYEGSKLLASDFTLTVTWTEGKADTHPTSGFTWTVNGVEDGDLASGNNTIVVTYSGVQSDSFQVSATAQTPNMYLANAESFATISGTEVSNASTITFANLGLTNGEEYTDPFEIGSMATAIFSSGSKYYTTGSGMRIYAAGTLTISAISEPITKIEFTWSGNYKPDSYTVSVGTYNKTTSIWTGDASNSITLTNGDSGQWRLQAIRVVCGADELVVNDLTLRFGVSIPVTDWNAINANENWEITDYGVMVFRTDAEHVESAPTPKSLYDINRAYVSWMHKGSGVAPTARDDKYAFSGRVNYTDGDSTYYASYMCAQAYIVVNGTDFYPVGQFMKKSVKTLAANVSSDCTNLSSSALAILAA